MSSPPGLAISAWPVRPTRAPRRRKEPRIRRVRSAPTEADLDPPGVEPPATVGDLLDDDPEVAEHGRHGPDVLDVRDVGQLQRLVGEQSRGHDRKGRVLAPGDRDLPGEPATAGDAEQVHRAYGT
jgi:hypothetical protein